MASLNPTAGVAQAGRLFAMFLVTHVVLVSMHPREIVNMITGGPRE